MINHFKQRTYMDLLGEGIQKARKIGKNILVSYVEKTDNMKPLAFYQAGEKMSQGRRCFWSDGEGLTLAAIGVAAEFIGESHHRYDDIKGNWENLLENVLVSHSLRGTGPLLLGGFAFDTNSLEKASTWSHFPSTAFVVPRLMLTEWNGDHWLTINTMIHPNDDGPNGIVEKIQGQLKSLEELIDAQPMTRMDDSSANCCKIKEQASSAEEWKQAVQRAVDRINAGELEKVVLSRTLNMEFDENQKIENIIGRLREQQPNSFVFAFERQGGCFIGATPERLMKQEGEMFYVDALAGTAPRGQNVREDELLGQALLEDNKNVQEHCFVVQMIKKTLKDICESVQVPEQPTLYKARDVQHLYTPLSGVAKPGSSLLDGVKALHPTPAMGGTPRTKALELIRDLEPHDRGWYAAPIGWIDRHGDGDFAVAIRSGLIHNHHAQLFAGCGIVRDSDPEREYQETEMKFQPMLKALKGGKL